MMMKSAFLTLLVFTTFVCFGNGVPNGEQSGVFGKLRSGLQLAGQLLGLDAASEVAKLVTESFGKPSKRGDTGEAGTNIFSGFFRLLGLESSKIGAIAVNAIVFLAQLISTSLSKPPPPELTRARRMSTPSPFDWLSRARNSDDKISELMKIAKDPDLPQRVVEHLKETSSDEDTGCVQLLICKSAPFLLGMQRALDAPSAKGTGASSMFNHLPTREEVAQHGDDCEEKYSTCLLN